MWFSSFKSEASANSRIQLWLLPFTLLSPEARSVSASISRRTSWKSAKICQGERDSSKRCKKTNAQRAPWSSQTNKWRKYLILAVQERTPLFSFDAWIDTKGVSAGLHSVRTENNHKTNVDGVRHAWRRKIGMSRILKGKNSVHE